MSVYSEIPEIVRHLLQKEAYPHPVSLPIRLEQTHTFLSAAHRKVGLQN